MIYEHALKPYTKLSKHTPKLSSTPGRRKVLKIGKKRQYHNISNAVQSSKMLILSKRFYKSKIAKQFVYNWLQLTKILSKFYRKTPKAAENYATIMCFPLTLGRLDDDTCCDHSYVTSFLITKFWMMESLWCYAY